MQIQQAIDAAKSQHQAILDQAAAVLGNKRQLEMKLNKLVKDQTAAQEKARAAIVAADEAAAAGDTDRAADLNGVAEVLVTQLSNSNLKTPRRYTPRQKPLQNKPKSRLKSPRLACMIR